MSISPSPTIIDQTVGELSAHPPFDQMDATLLRTVAARLAVRYFAKGTTIMSPADGVVNRLVIIQRGTVSGTNQMATTNVGDGLLTLTEGEMFPIGAVMSRRATVLTFTAMTDVFCYEMPLPVFEDAIDRSRPFRHFATRRLAHLLEQSRRNTQSQFSNKLSEAQTLASSLKTILRRDPVTVLAQTSIRDVLELMKRERIGSVVVLDDQIGENAARPVGIFTERDVFDRVALPQVDQTQSVSTVMTTNPFSLPSHAPLFDAAKAMVEYRFRHVLVTEQGRLIGVISERDLFAQQRLSLGEIAKSIDRSETVAALAGASADVRQMAAALVGQGVAAEQLTQFVTTMNDAIVGRALALARAECAPPDVPWCWMGLGSEGRMEQTLATDQDNAIIFSLSVDFRDEARDPIDLERVRSGLLAFATVVNQILNDVGFPLCRGDIMAKNPQWCLSEAEWRSRFGEWMRAISSKALLNAAIFFDFRALHGEAGLVDNLKSWLVETVVKQPLFLRQMAVNALQVRPPIGFLGFFGDFAESDADHPDTMDLKVYAARPFIDAARILALAHHVGATNTAERLRLVGPKVGMTGDECNAYVDAFHFIQLLRLRIQQLPLPDGLADKAVAADVNPNRILLDSLNDLDRRILKETLRQARKLQSRLELDFQI